MRDRSFKHLAGLLLLVLLFMIMAGCTRQPPGGQDGAPQQNGSTTAADNKQLAALLPDREGYIWYYNGFAEYGHRMTLDTINIEGDNYTYNISGVVDDPSGGEAQNRDFNLQITYTIADGTMVQTKRESAMLDSEFDRLELIRTPLAEGTRWTQQVTNRESNETSLECTIEDVRKDGETSIYTVSYRDQNSDYYEKREFKTGVGLISFEKLLVLQDQSFPAGYSLNEDASGY